MQARVITEEEKKFRAYATLRKQLRDAKNVGKHAKKLAEEAEAEKKVLEGERQISESRSFRLLLERVTATGPHPLARSIESTCKETTKNQIKKTNFSKIYHSGVLILGESPTGGPVLRSAEGLGIRDRRLGGSLGGPLWLPRGEASVPLQGLPYTPYAPPSGGLSILLPLPASPRHLIGRGGGPPPPCNEAGGAPRHRSAPRASSNVAEYIRRSLCDPYTPRASPSPRITRGAPQAAAKGGSSRGPSPQRSATAPLPSAVKARAGGLQTSPLQPGAQRAQTRQQQQQQQQPQRRATLPSTRLAGRNVSPNPGKGAPRAPLPGPFQGLPTVEALTAALTRNQQELAKLNTNLRQQQQQQQQQQQRQPRVSLPEAPMTSRQRGVEGPSSHLRAQGVRATPLGGPCRRARSEEARPSLGAPSFSRARGLGTPIGAPRTAAAAATAAASPWSRRENDASSQQLRRSVCAASSLDGKLQELRRALMHLTQQAGEEGTGFGDIRGDASHLQAARKREALLQTVGPSSLLRPVFKRTPAAAAAASKSSSSYQKQQQRQPQLTKAAAPATAAAAASISSSSSSSSSRFIRNVVLCLCGCLQALTEARANLTAARDQVSRLRRLILPLQHGVAAFAAVQRREASAQGAPYHPFTPYTPAAAPQGGPDGPRCAQELGDFRGRMFDDPGRDGGPLIPSLSDMYAPSSGGPPPLGSDEEGPLGPFHNRSGAPEELQQDSGKRPPPDTPYSFDGGPPLLRGSSCSVGRELHGGAPLEKALAGAPQAYRPLPEEEGGDTYLRGDSRGEGLSAHEGEPPPSTSSQEREAPSRGPFSLSSGKPPKPSHTKTP
ncbi:hypothetical protein ACSSS7_001618 [Eimeria intestinalis]